VSSDGVLSLFLGFSLMKDTGFAGGKIAFCYGYDLSMEEDEELIPLRGYGLGLHMSSAWLRPEGGAFIDYPESTLPEIEDDDEYCGT